MKTSSVLFLFALVGLIGLNGCSDKRDHGESVTIIPFHSVNGIIPGIAKYSSVQDMYGAPEEIETLKKETLAGIPVGGNRIIHYRSKGISFLLSKDADAVIEGVYVEPPYRGRTPNGLFLGMNKSDAVLIIQRDYYISMDLGESLTVARDSGHADNFQVWFTAGILTRMKLFPS